MPSSKKSLTVDYKQLHSFSSVVLYDTATRSKHRGRFYDAERIITRLKCGSVSLVLFLTVSGVIPRVSLFFPPCIRLARLKFELTNQHSASGKILVS